MFAVLQAPPPPHPTLLSFAILKTLKTKNLSVGVALRFSEGKELARGYISADLSKEGAPVITLQPYFEGVVLKDEKIPVKISTWGNHSVKY